MPRGVAVLLTVGACSGDAPVPVTSDQVDATSSAASPTTQGRMPAPPRRPKGRGQVIRELAGVTIGAPIETALETVMGDSKSYKENALETERKEWADLGYHVESEMPFLVGFDRAYTFDTPRVPIYMLFARSGKVVLIRASSYVTNEESQRSVRIVDGCGLNSPSVCTELTFLDPALVQSQPMFGRDIHHWLQHGVSMTVEGGSVRVIDVYGDLDPDAQSRMDEELRKPTPAPVYYD